MRLTYWRKNTEDDPECVSIKVAKKMLKSDGGEAWTEHYERDGTMFQVTPIRLKGNNSSFSYNRHL